jgi:hypothetical protein
MNTRLVEINAKIERAKNHLLDLNTEIKKFIQTKPYEVEDYDEEETGDRVWIVHVRSEPPIQLGAIVGDLLNNLRSSLDYLVFELAERRGGSKLYFPICNTADEFDSAITKIEKFILCNEAIQILREVQAYKGGGGHGLWQLHQLNRREKHRFLIPVGTANTQATTSMPSAMMEMMRKFRKPLFHPGIFHVKPGNRVFPLKDGTELYRLLASGRPGVVGNDPRFTFEMAFGEGEIFIDDPIFPTLRNLTKLVVTTINKFVPLLGEV